MHGNISHTFHPFVLRIYFTTFYDYDYLPFFSLRFDSAIPPFIFTFNTRPCNGCDLPANRTDITTMTSFRYDGVHYISERIGLWFCMGTMMTMVTDYVHDERDIQICS